MFKIEALNFIYNIYLLYSEEVSQKNCGNAEAKSYNR